MLISNIYSLWFWEWILHQIFRTPFILWLKKIKFDKILNAKYFIFWDTNNFEYANMSYDRNNSLNMDIGYSFRETAYKWREKPFFQIDQINTL